MAAFAATTLSLGSCPSAGDASTRPASAPCTVSTPMMRDMAQEGGGAL